MQRALGRNQAPQQHGHHHHHHNHHQHHQTAAAGEQHGGGGPLESALSCLWVLTPFAATVSLAVVVVALLTNQWLHTEEKMNNPSYNGTGDKDYLSKMTVSGLWTLCFTNPGETRYECEKIDYFTKEVYSPDPNDSTMAIPYAVTRSVFFFAAATFLLMGAYCCCIMGHCVKQRGLYTFISGVAFIVTGLIMLFGLIMYISIFKAEIGGKLRPRSQLQPPAFTYSYGFSFLLYVVGFISTQLAGISSIFLFIYKTQYDYRLKHLDDLRRGKLRPPTTVNYVPLEHNTFYPCRRHPQAYINSNSIHIPTNYPSPAQRRYFFSKEPLQESPCSLHRAANSLKDVSNFYDFPPPPTISYQFDERYNSREASSVRMFPRDVTTNTVSTTADVADGDNDAFTPEHFEDYTPPGGGVHHHQLEHEFVTFDLDQPLPLRTQSTVSINSSRNGRNDTMRRTTPV